MPLAWLKRLFGVKPPTPASDLSRVVTLVHDELERRQIAHALIGGLALSTVGVVRATKDVDYLVDADYAEDLDHLMRSLGFREVRLTDNVRSYVLGELYFVDCILARRPYARAMLEDSVAVETMGRTLRVVRPEDLIGLKIQANSNNPERVQDLVDIEQVLRANRDKLDLDRIREYYELFDRGDEIDELLQRITRP